MQKSKKTLSLLITTLLTLSMIVAAVPLASAAVTVGLDLTSGAVGTQVTVTGSGANPFGQVTIYLDSTSGQVLNTTAADNTGAFTCKVTIPSTTNGVHYIVAQDSLGATGGAAFTVTANLLLGPMPGVPVYALPGDSLQVAGHGFAASKTVTIYLNTTSGNVTLTNTVTTNSTGSFSASVVIPTIAEADFGKNIYVVNATDQTGVNATGTINVDYYIVVMPFGTMPPGVSITIFGRIPKNKDYEIQIDTTTVATGTSDGAGNFMKTYQLPTLIGSGGHTAKVIWDVVNFKSTTFNVGPSPTITLGATSGIAGAKVTISGSSFSTLSNITLTFGTTVVNSTATDPRFGPTDSTGAFSEDFAVPALAPGPYIAKVTDQYGASAQAAFTILPAPTTTIAPRASQYLQGDTISFTIATTDPTVTSVGVTIRDPAGGVWWSGITWTVDTVTMTVPYADQVDNNGNPLKLPDDAPTGSWNWTITYLSTTATGLFTVSAKPTLASVQDQINQLTAQINSLGGNFSSITSQLNSINSQLSSISSTVSGISGAASSAASAANSAASAAQSAKSAADAAKASADSAVSAIQDATSAAQSAASAANAAKASADSAASAVDDATAAAEGAKAAAEGVSMAVWIAVVLSLVAAIAAIFAVITIRGKIAG